MDTSLEYVNMCDKALSDISWEIPTIAFDSKREGEIYEYNQKTYVIKDNGLSPIFRQDQLQEMIKKFISNDDNSYKAESNNITLTLLFYDFCSTRRIEKFNDSYEILWLKYLMYCIYNKTWNGEEWIL